MAQLDNGIEVPDWVVIAGKTLLVETYDRAVELAHILGDDDVYGIQITDREEELKMIHKLFGGG